MQRKLRTLLVIGSLFAAAALAFIACGSGEMVEIDAKIQEIDGASTSLKNKIDDILEDYEPESSSSSEPEYSSAAPEESSSSRGSTGGQSSSSSQGSQGGQSSSSSQGSTGGQSSSSSQASGGKSSSSPQTSTGGCGTATQSGFTCKWDNLKPLPNDKINAEKTGSCEVSQWYYKDATSSFADCFKFGGSDLEAKGSKSYYLFADIDCGGTKASVTCNSTAVTATAPTLDGTCTWSKNPTSAAMGAKPSGVKLKDPSGICGSGADGKDAVYKDGSTTWPANGMVDAGTYSNVKATYDCGSHTVEPKSCPALTVSAVEANMIACDGGWAAANCTALSKDLELGDCLGVEVINIPPGDQHNKPTHGFNVICGVKTHSANNDDQVVTFEMKYNGTPYSSTGNYHAAEINNSVGKSVADASYHYPDLTGAKVCFTGAHQVSKVTCRLEYKYGG